MVKADPTDILFEMSAVKDGKVAVPSCGIFTVRFWPSGYFPSIILVEDVLCRWNSAELCGIRVEISLCS